MLEVQTAIAGELYNINTFNQPGVEQAKNYTYALMGRAGYEESAHTLQEKWQACNLKKNKAARKPCSVFSTS